MWKNISYLAKSLSKVGNSEINIMWMELQQSWILALEQ